MENMVLQTNIFIKFHKDLIVFYSPFQYILYKLTVFSKHNGHIESNLLNFSLKISLVNIKGYLTKRLLIGRIQRGNQNSAKHLRWSFLRK